MGNALRVRVEGVVIISEINTVSREFTIKLPLIVYTLSAMLFTSNHFCAVLVSAGTQKSAKRFMKFPSL
jgi:hypothetical protein